MLNSKYYLKDLELFEEIDDQVSEKISGGASIDGLLDEIAALQILDQDLKVEIDKKILELFPKGLGNASSLSCVTTDKGKFDCKVSSNGKTKKFNVPLK